MNSDAGWDNYANELEAQFGRTREPEPSDPYEPEPEPVTVYRVVTSPTEFSYAVPTESGAVEWFGSMKRVHLFYPDAELKIVTPDEFDEITGPVTEWIWH